MPSPLHEQESDAMSASEETRAPATLSDRVQSLRLPPRGGVGSSGKLPWVLCVLLLGSTLTFGYQAFRKPGSDAGPEGGKAAPQVQKKDADSGDVVLQSKGYIIPAHMIQVAPQVGGKVEELKIEEGMRVKKGQVLARLESIEYDAKHKHAVAKYESARQSWELLKASYPEEVKRAKHDLDEARADYARIKDQLDRGERLDSATMSREELIKMRNETAMTDARLKRRKQDLELAELGRWKVTTAKAEMDAAKAEVDEAKWRLDNCTIIAPVQGTILTKDAEENNLINPVAFNVASRLCSMADLSDLEVDLNIQERDIAGIVVGQKCDVLPEAFEKNEKFLKKHPKGYDGVVSRLMPIADRAKGAIPIRVKVRVPREEEGVYLKPDMGVIVSFKKVEK
jgi:multidrug resistance efflux pump